MYKIHLNTRDVVKATRSKKIVYPKFLFNYKKQPARGTFIPNNQEGNWVHEEKKYLQVEIILTALLLETTNGRILQMFIEYP